MGRDILLPFLANPVGEGFDESRTGPIIGSDVWEYQLENGGMKMREGGGRGRNRIKSCLAVILIPFFLVFGCDGHKYIDCSQSMQGWRIKQVRLINSDAHEVYEENIADGRVTKEELERYIKLDERATGLEDQIDYCLNAQTPSAP